MNEYKKIKSRLLNNDTKEYDTDIRFVILSINKNYKKYDICLKN